MFLSVSALWDRTVSYFRDQETLGNVLITVVKPKHVKVQKVGTKEFALYKFKTSGDFVLLRHTEKYPQKFVKKYNTRLKQLGWSQVQASPLRKLKLVSSFLNK